MFGKGIDIRSVDTIIDAGATPGRNGTIQRYGRGARKAEGKHGLLYIDVSDVGSKFAGAARNRTKALEELGTEIVEIPWKGSGVSGPQDLKAHTEKVFEECLENLRRIEDGGSNAGKAQRKNG